ncbi:outer membrane beta-barrel protein [Algoriphagus sp. H41]|uniref:Outer membrane beta-barrel protein n=1 Tax=Algoriphagus oliviformis TaxID=2811231 RepID=A0ABS3BZE7_9BACT|nr:outer membrane beta-barrel protein [Algoriphagus oliviformis]MBN7810229.1 outer membrane beta-barrel protein [Algoriphagus oliviformis]
MRKSLLLFAMLFVFAIQSHGQEKGDARIHTLGLYGLEYKDFGIGGGVEYFFADRFALMPSFAKIYPEVGNLSNFSFDLRYYVTGGPSQLYFMAGYSQNFQNTAPGQAGTRESYVGANAGVGAYVGLTDWVGLSTEFRIQTQYRQEASFRIGLAFPL